MNRSLNEALWQRDDKKTISFLRDPQEKPSVVNRVADSKGPRELLGQLVQHRRARSLGHPVQARPG
jgi:hypothetical protein